MAVDIERRQIGDQLSLLDPAQLPQAPIGPSVRDTTLTGGAMGLALAALIALVAIGATELVLLASLGTGAAALRRRSMRACGSGTTARSNRRTTSCRG